MSTSDTEADIDFLLSKIANLECRLEKVEPKPAYKAPDDDLPSGQFIDFAGHLRHESGDFVRTPEMIAANEKAYNDRKAAPMEDFDREGLPNGQFRYLGQVYTREGVLVATVEANQERIKESLASFETEGE